MNTIVDIIPKINKPLSIIIIGGGGIVTDAHLPAYQLAGYKVAGIFDRDLQKASDLAKKFNIPKIYQTNEEVVADWQPGMIFDIAVPATNIIEIIDWLPQNCAALIQKPFGEDLQAARAILNICKEKKIRAAVNFQLRYAPAILMARQIIKDGGIGEIRDIEVRVTCNTPWNLWPFLYDIPRLEILYHSIHYIDLIRSFCGNPLKVYAKTIGTPEFERVKNCRSTIVLDYGESIRANIETNHLHNYGSELHESYFKCEGTQGALKANLGVNLDYPKGKPDYLKYYNLKEDKKAWQDIAIAGNWFPHAFIGSMGSVLLSEDGQIEKPSTAAEDAFATMAIVEAAYDASEHAGLSTETYLKK